MPPATRSIPAVRPGAGLGGEGLRDPDSVSINDYAFGGDMDGLFQRGQVRERLGRKSKKTGRRGKSRMSIEIQGEPVVHNFAEVRLGKGPANAIGEILQSGIRQVTARVAPSTFRWRQSVGRNYPGAEGTARYSQRFRGGRIGEMPPPASPTRQMFNHTRRMADNITTRENRTDKSWTVNVPNNRLNPREFANRADFERMVDQLHRHVPEIGDPRALNRHPEFRHAVVDSIGDMIQAAEARGQAGRQRLRRTAFGALRRIGGMARAAL